MKVQHILRAQADGMGDCAKTALRVVEVSVDSIVEHIARRVVSVDVDIVDNAILAGISERRKLGDGSRDVLPAGCLRLPVTE
jgi:arginase family enzyme